MIRATAAALLALLLWAPPARAQDPLRERLEDIVFLYYDSYGRDAGEEVIDKGIEGVGVLILEGWTIDDIEQTVWRVLNEVPEAATEEFGDLVLAKARQWGKPGAAAEPEAEPGPETEPEPPPEPAPEPEPAASDQPVEPETTDASSPDPVPEVIITELPPDEPVTPVIVEPIEAEPEPTSTDPKPVTEGPPPEPEPAAQAPPSEPEPSTPEPRPQQSPAPQPTENPAVARYRREMRSFNGRRAVKTVGAAGSAVALGYAWAEQAILWNRLEDFSLGFWAAFPVFGPVLLLSTVDSGNHNVIWNTGDEGPGTEQEWRVFGIRGTVAQLASLTSLLIFASIPNQRPVLPTLGARPPVLYAPAVVPTRDGGLRIVIQLSF